MDEWPALLGWPSGLATPAIEATYEERLTIARRRYRDGIPELRVLGSGNPTSIWSRWIAAVRAAGGTVENERSGTDWASATVCARDCGASPRHLATITTDSWIRFTLRPAAPRAPQPPGACVPVPSDAWNICFEVGSGRAYCSFPYGTRWDVDVDRDGAPDALVPRPAGRRPELTCPDEVEWDVYVSRGACGHHVGRLRGGLDRWHQLTAEISHGLVVLTTGIEPRGPSDEGVTLRNAFDGVRYREVAMTVHESRCSIHPADCENPMGPMSCAVRGHPTLIAPYDYRVASATVGRLAEEAQAQCGAGVSPPVRCAIDLTIPQDGTPRLRGIRGCGSATSCVERIFRRAAFPRHSSDPGMIGISFQIPVP